ncbi:hypothetical protein E7Z53_18120 [Kocuria salina]|uniref:hypothetical protein n=1 Tax=Kocuria salina TaxID=1929416 RepID=UPI00159377F6|nr:hypothetical protein [Kocuria salina]NVC25337.1 hypothetical protein [Kocuria salina]
MADRAPVLEFRTRFPARHRVMLRLLAVAVTIVGLVPVIAGNVGMVGVVATAVIAAPFWWLAFFQTVVDLEAEAVAIRYGGIFGRRVPYDQILEVRESPTRGFIAGWSSVSISGITGYLVGGPTVRIDTKPTAVLVSTDQPRRLVEEIRQRIAGYSGGREPEPQS